MSLWRISRKTAATVTDDVQAIPPMTSNVTDEGKDIILRMHSDDGVPRPESAHGVTKKKRSVSGKKGGVLALLYATMFLVGPGKSLGSTMGEGAGVPNCVNAVHLLPFST
jgi:hypothetical protein